MTADILKENYISMEINSSTLKVILDFESDNLEKFIKLDTNNNGLISWNEIKAKKEEIKKLVLPHMNISSDGKLCKKKIVGFEVYRRIHQSYIKLDIKLDCPRPHTEIKVFYDLFFDVDKVQKGFFSLKGQNNSNPMIFSTSTKTISVKLKQTSAFESFSNFFKEGVWHIWIGFDHVLFLLMLLIPAVIYYENKKIIPQNSLKDTLIEVLKIVTAFSVAHSITLGLSVLQIVTIDSKFVEIAIALSVLFTALNNVFAWVKHKIWILSFTFGLIHGFGFANVLKEMTLHTTELLRSLLGFNLGVEIGQVAIVLVVVPILYLLRKTLFYRRVILYGLSALTIIVSLFWAIERLELYQ